MSADTAKAAIARKALIDFYLKDKKNIVAFGHLTPYTTDAYWESLNTPRVVGPEKRKEKDFMFEGFFTSAAHVGYQLSDGSGAYILWRHLPTKIEEERENGARWQEHPNLLKGWSIKTVWDITDLVLPPSPSSFLNWTTNPWSDLK